MFVSGNFWSTLLNRCFVNTWEKSGKLLKPVRIQWEPVLLVNIVFIYLAGLLDIKQKECIGCYIVYEFQLVFTIFL